MRRKPAKKPPIKLTPSKTLNYPTPEEWTFGPINKIADAIREVLAKGIDVSGMILNVPFQFTVRSKS
jgi:hypothetical protein